MATTDSALQELRGVITHLTYANAENGYFVARVDVPQQGERTLVGRAPVINIGEEFRARGKWEKSNWGLRFNAVTLTLSIPTMAGGIEKYLASSVEGIGKGCAKKLVATFGDQVFAVIEHEPHRLAEVKGIGPKKRESIVASFLEQRDVKDIMVFLHGMGLSASKATRVHKHYGEGALALIKENPYILCRDIWGIGFLKADEAARKLGIAPNSEYRARAGIQHVLETALGVGSCGLPEQEVINRASELLGVDHTLLERCVELEIASDALVRGTADGQTCLFRKVIYHTEEALAKVIMELASLVPARPIQDVDLRILEAEMELGIELGDSQREAARIALSNRVCVMTGGPGTGKTTITKLILKVLEDSTDRSVGGHGVRPDIVVAAPTGKAAKRASEATGRSASTVHRVLEFTKDGKFKHDRKTRLDGDAFVADEFSMADVFLSYSFIQAIPDHGRLLVVGDVDQLESVGPGKVLADLIDSGVLPVVRLTDVYRQAAKSDIIKNAHAVNRGELPRFGYVKGSDFQFELIEAANPSDEDQKRKARELIAEKVVKVSRALSQLGYDPIRDVQVLSPMRKGLLGVEALNLALQAALNPNPEAVLEANGARWCTGDKVLQMRNNYDKGVFNGDQGFIVGVDTVARELTVEFSGSHYVYKLSELDELTLAYAMSVHRSQGSEFPVVIMPVDMSHYTLLRRNLVFTGITRARKLFIGYGSRSAMKRAVETVGGGERYTRLKECLRDAALRVRDPARTALAA